MGWRKTDWRVYIQSRIEEEQRERAERQARRNRLPDYGRCPECGGYLRKRNGKHGEFLGCSNYPECRHTEKLEK